MSDRRGGTDSALRRSRVLPNALATLALLVALGGSAYAALDLPSGRVDTSAIRREAVTAAKVRPGTISLADFAPSQRALLRGSPGAPGPQGPAGPRGPRGAAGPQGTTDLVVRTFERTNFPAESFVSVGAACEPNERATGGGVHFIGPSNNEIVQQDMPIRTSLIAIAEEGDVAQAWRTLIRTGPAIEPRIIGYVICARS